MALILRMSVTKGLVAVTGWSMDATFQRDRQVKARPRAADDDDSAGECQGTIREQLGSRQRRRQLINTPLSGFRSVGHNSWQGSLGGKQKPELVVGRNKNNDSPDEMLSAQQTNNAQPIGLC